jgi:hypothetical protein
MTVRAPAAQGRASEARSVRRGPGERVIPGSTTVPDNRWHRPPTILFRDFKEIMSGLSAPLLGYIPVWRT